jgi:hypothetical protein
LWPLGDHNPAQPTVAPAEKRENATSGDGRAERHRRLPVWQINLPHLPRWRTL